MRLRPIEERDLDAVLRLRNENREWFFSAESVSKEQHRRWFAGLAHSSTRFYVMEEDGEVIGTASVKETSEGFEFGNLIVDQRHRGLGLAAQTVAELTAAPGRYFSNLVPTNVASKRTLERVGFSVEHIVLSKTVPPD